MEELEPESLSLHSQSIAPFLPLILISTNLGVLQQRTIAAQVKLKLEMETRIMNRQRILPSLLLIIFCPAILRFFLEGMTSGDQGTAGSQVIRHGFISLSGFPSLRFCCCCLFVCLFVFANFLSQGTVCWEPFEILLGNIGFIFQNRNVPFLSC